VPAGLIVVIGLVVLGGSPQSPSAPADPPNLEERVRRLEEMNRLILEQNRVLLEQGQIREQQAEERYRHLQRQYQDLRISTAKGAITAPATPPSPLADERKDSPSATPTELTSTIEPRGRRGRDRLSMRAVLGEGVEFQTEDEEYQLRLHILDQTDAKFFVPGDQSPARSGLYIPRVRLYFEGQMTRLFDYEVSIQRSVEGVWDLLDGNVNLHPSDAIQLKFGRTLVPYSYDWYDHLEQ